MRSNDSCPRTAENGGLRSRETGRRNRSVNGKPCIFCGAPGSSTGEHVTPKWLNKKMRNDWGGPFPAHRNGVPHLDRDGEVWTSDSPLTYMAPCCENHNEVLNMRFERHQPQVGAFLNGETYDHIAVGKWWLKTLLLFVHHDTIETSSTAEMIQYGPLSQTEDLYSWMVTGEDPPAGLHIFCALAMDPAAAEPDRTLVDSILLREWSYKGMTYTPAIRHVGLANVQFQLIYAPGYVIEHPASAAHRIWPPNPGRFTNRGTLSADEQARWRNAYYAGGALILMSDIPSPLEEPLRVGPGRGPAWYTDSRIRGATA